MRTSETTAELFTSLARAQGELEHAAKDKSNPAFRSKYADLAGVVDTLKPVFAKHGLSVVQGNTPSDDGVLVTTRVCHLSGEWIEDDGLHVPAEKRNGHGFGSALTYARRYSLMAMTGIAPDDDDGNAASAVPARKPAPARKTPPKVNKQLVNKTQQKVLVEAAVAAGFTQEQAEARAAEVPRDQYDTVLAHLKAQQQGDA